MRAKIISTRSLTNHWKLPMNHQHGKEGICRHFTTESRSSICPKTTSESFRNTLWQVDTALNFFGDSKTAGDKIGQLSNIWWAQIPWAQIVQRVTTVSPFHYLTRHTLHTAPFFLEDTFLLLASLVIVASISLLKMPLINLRLLEWFSYFKKEFQEYICWIIL
jgi:hypothetical protein